MLNEHQNCPVCTALLACVRERPAVFFPPKIADLIKGKTAAEREENAAHLLHLLNGMVASFWEDELSEIGPIYYTGLALASMGLMVMSSLGPDYPIDDFVEAFQLMRKKVNETRKNTPSDSDVLELPR